MFVQAGGAEGGSWQGKARGRDTVTFCQDFFSSCCGLSRLQDRSRPVSMTAEANQGFNPPQGQAPGAPVAPGTQDERQASRTSGDNAETSSRVNIHHTGAWSTPPLPSAYQRVALVRGMATGVLTAAVFRAVTVILKRQPPRETWKWHAFFGICGAAGGWYWTLWEQRVHDRGLARLRRNSVTGMAFMDLGSLAPPMPHDSYTEAGEIAAAQLLEEEARRRRRRHL
ncbi:transmembrane protein [Cystoisospora suis]|uniref:Transmembrane protein n=1 Tax=Cystoisospora suis TaxID=483139 RepID=A0A2C6KKW0_9APIC|nr:transmembrane protein [Cystoisospora suis]